MNAPAMRKIAWDVPFTAIISSIEGPYSLETASTKARLRLSG
jgi:hypothetical protein